jgi:DNA repair exonuclease SbcCD ATPase subunit
MNIGEFFGNDNSFTDTKSSNSENSNSEHKCDLCNKVFENKKKFEEHKNRTTGCIGYHRIKELLHSNNRHQINDFIYNHEKIKQNKLNQKIKLYEEKEKKLEDEIKNLKYLLNISKYNLDEKIRFFKENKEKDLKIIDKLKNEINDLKLINPNENDHECSICFNNFTFKTPIKVCINNHSEKMCNECLTKCDTCPLCRGKFI